MAEQGFYDPIGVTKSRICSLIANSKQVRDALDYQGKDPAYKYDPSDPMTLIWNCIIPVLKDPDTITTSDPQILVGVETSLNYNDPRSNWIYGTIAIIVDNSDLRTDVKYIRPDLLQDGICSYTKPDLIAYMIKQALNQASKTWIGEIEFIESTEGITNNTTHYGRTIKFRVKELNLENRGI